MAAGEEPGPGSLVATDGASVVGRLLEHCVMRGAVYPVQNLPVERRREILTRLREAAEAHGVRLDVCACKNADMARGSCNIAGTWPARPDGRPSGRTLRATQPALIG